MAFGWLPKSSGKGKRLICWSTSYTRVTLEPLLVEAPFEENLDHLVIVGEIDLKEGEK